MGRHARKPLVHRSPSTEGRPPMSAHGSLRTTSGRRYSTNCRSGYARPDGWPRWSRPILTVEEAYLLCQFIRGIDGEALLGNWAGTGGGRGRAVPERVHHLRGEVSEPPRRGGHYRPLCPSRGYVRRTVVGDWTKARCEAFGHPGLRNTLRRPGDCRKVRAAGPCWWCKICSPRR